MRPFGWHKTAALQGVTCSQFFETPVAIVKIFELGDGRSDFFEVAKDSALDGPLLQRLDKALRHAVGLGCGRKGEAGFDTPPLAPYRSVWKWSLALPW